MSFENSTVMIFIVQNPRSRHWDKMILRSTLTVRFDETKYNGLTCINMQQRIIFDQIFHFSKRSEKNIVSPPFVFICFVFRLLRLPWRHVSSAWEAPVLIEPLTTKADSATQYFVEHAILILVELDWGTTLYRDHCKFWGVMGFVTCLHFQTPHIRLQTIGLTLVQL